MLEGVDISYAQGNYHPGSEAFVIINASRANVGLVVGSMYRTQLANARAAGKHVGHYFFNGNKDPVQCANFFVDNLDYRAGDSLWLDVESEPGTGTAAWTPSQTLAFINQVYARMRVVPGVYLNKSLMDGYNWSSVVATGAPLWIAYYNSNPPAISWWPTWTLWQYTSTPIDRDRSQSSSLASIGGTPLTGGFLMSLSDDQQRQIYEALVQGGVSASAYYKTDAIINIIRQELAPVVQRVDDALNKPSALSGQFRPIDVLLSQTPVIMSAVTAHVDRDGKTVSQAEDNAVTGTLVRQLVASVAALQAAISAVSGVSGADPEAVKNAAEAGATAALQNFEMNLNMSGKATH